MQKKWVFHQPDTEKVKALMQSLKISEQLSRILVQRGIETYDQAKEYFNPEISLLHDPFIMKDMDKAVNRIYKAISSTEKILIYGDYDVDGTTSVALMYLFLLDIYPNITCYIPDRNLEGYGISEKGINTAFELGVKLIIALDCGISAIDKVAYAKSKDIDIIICDHHLPGAELPDAIAILDPKQSGCHYPYKELSGCGIGFKLGQALSMHLHIPQEKILGLIDLVALSIASDIVPITGENRVLAHFGLIKINTKPLTGIKAILDIAGLNRKVTINELVFWVGPRINAAGRIGHASTALKLLITEDEEDRLKLAHQLNDQNNIRKQLDQEITEEALEKISDYDGIALKATSVVYHPDWHKGVIGIVASRLIEHYYRPTIVLCKSGDVLTGSARSIKGFDIFSALQACRHHLLQFGGHMYAAGLTLLPEKLDDFIKAFETVVADSIGELEKIPIQSIDAELNLTELTDTLANTIKRMAPFGPGNMKPVFASFNVRDTGFARIVGEKHLKLNIALNESKGVNAIAFGASEFYPKIQHSKFSICYTLDENEWQGRVTTQLNIKGINTDVA